MRKITSLLMLFCAFVGAAWAGPTDLPEITTDLENPIYYTIVNTRSSQPGGFMYYAGDEVGLKDEQVAGVEAKHMFYFTGSHDALYVHNAATGKKLASVSSWTEEGTVWAVGVSPKGGGLAFGPQGGLNGNACWNEKNYATNSNTSDFTTWSANDDGSIFVVNLVEDYDINVDAFYTIECPLFEQVQGVKKGLVVDGEGNLGWNTVDLTNKNCYWIPTKVEGNAVALKNLGTGKFLNGTGLSDEAVDATVKVLGQAQYNIVLNGTTVHANGHGNGASASGNIVNWGGAANSASAWQFVEQQDPDAVQSIEITYEFTYKGEKLDPYTQTVNTVTGAEYPNITASFPFGVSATKPEGTIAMEDAPAKTVTIEVEVNLPFVPATDYASIKNWYYIQMHSSAGYGKYLQNTETYIEWADATVNADEIDSYTWGFVGNVFDGFKLVNYATGETKGINSDGSGNPAMGDIDTATLWQIKASRVNPDAEHFCFQYLGSNKYMNAQSGKVAFWTDNDQGSTMWVTERDMSGRADLQAAIDAVVAENYVGGETIGCYTTASVAAVNEALDAAREALQGELTAEISSQKQAALQAAVSALQVILPEEGKYYVIESAKYTGDLVYAHKDNKIYHSNQKTNNLSEVIWQFESNGDGTLSLYSVSNNQYISELGWLVPSSLSDATTCKFTIHPQGNGVVFIKGNGNEMHAQGANAGELVRYNTNEKGSASSWYIKEVDAFSYNATITDAGYSTLILGFNTIIPNDVEAYAVTEAGNGVAEMTQVTGVLPAKQAVILKGVAKDYEFAYTNETATVEGNLLKGTLFNTNIAEEAYVLGNNGGVGLYKAILNQNEGTAFLNNANKAYLLATDVENTPQGTLRFKFGETTGIEGVIEGINANAVIFDLSGRRVAKMQKGIYIVNGKKVYVK